MKTQIKEQKSPGKSSNGFALVVSLTMLVLLTIIAVGMLSLSAITIRTTTQTSFQAEAQANARMALMIAIGELQKEMGPDMRVSAESAIFDNSPNSEGISGVEQSRWLASYNSWGNWLNAQYEIPDGGSTISIADTYTPRRDVMFRRWLLSLPDGMESDVNAPNSIGGWDDDNSVVLVGQGTLGDNAPTDQITRARLIPVGEGGHYAWWISPENHRAKINLGRRDNNLTADRWENAHGNTAEVAVNLIDGFGSLEDGGEVRKRLITKQTLEAAGIDRNIAQGSFFDLSAHSQGVLSSVRTGHLKKDLSLLFELNNAQLPDRYKFNAAAIQEPSIRPISPDLRTYDPKIPNRHLASWTNMRHFHRMYRSNSDATIGGTAAGNSNAGALQWDRGKPWTTFVATSEVGSQNPNWKGGNNYWRFPVLAKITFIYSLRATPEDPNADLQDPETRFRCSVVYTPVFVFWNPYNVELRVPDNQFYMMNNAYRVLPFMGEVYENNERTSERINGASQSFSNLRSALRSDDGGPIVFRPGEFRVFSHRGFVSGYDNNALRPGFDPQAIGGEDRAVATYTREQNPSAALMFSESAQHGNHQWGNTPGSLCHTPDWNGGGNRIPLMSQNDWFNVEQTRTPITPDPQPNRANVATRPQHLAPWDFNNPTPTPVAYAQLSIKGVSPIDYESIDWDLDWRARNWLHAPPFYFGNAMYISENDTIAHTQRIDNPYMMHFGPASMAEMPRIISHVGSSAFLGSGSNPFEQVNAVTALELPTAPVTSLAGFSGMRTNPGWADFAQLNSPPLRVQGQGAIGLNTSNSSFFAAEVKATAYQSGVTGAGIGNSFIHPMIPRTEVYGFLENSISMDPQNRRGPFTNLNENNNKIFNDHWDHTFLVNDALWDDYFMSSLSDETRPRASSPRNLNALIEDFANGEQIANSRISVRQESPPEQIIEDLSDDAEGYLKAAQHMMVDGMFNVNSTSVSAWHALFAGIRDRTAVYRTSNGLLSTITPPSGSRIAITRFNTEITDQEMEDPGNGVNLGSGLRGWSGVRFLTDEQLTKLAEECVRQVKLRGPFLNFSEFINRRLSNDELGLMGALQSAIDYDDDAPDPASINYRFKNGPDFMMNRQQAGTTMHATPEALNGSRFAGIPGYVIQSDILKPIANTLSVRDDTFRIRAYGESLDRAGNVVARAWCEAIVQRVPDYVDPSNDPSEPLRSIRITNSDGSNGTFQENNDITEANRRFGRKFQIVNFRWLSGQEI